MNLTTKYEIEKLTDCKDKRFSFFADPQKKKAESRHTFGTLPFARHMSQRFAKVKEPNLPTHKILFGIIINKLTLQKLKEIETLA